MVAIVRLGEVLGAASENKESRYEYCYDAIEGDEDICTRWSGTG